MDQPDTPHVVKDPGTPTANPADPKVAAQCSAEPIANHACNPGPPPLGRAVIIGNGRSGAGKRSRDRLIECVDAVRAGLGEPAGADPRRAGIASQLKAARTAKPDTVIAVGGDGTINAAASVAIHAGATLIIIPCGTMNLVARDLGIDLEGRAIADTFASPRPVHVDYATVNGELFLHSSHLGVVPQATTTRERIRSSKSWLRRARLARIYVTRIISSPKITVTMRSDRGPAEIATRAVAVFNNPLADDAVPTLRRASLDSGHFGVYALEQADRRTVTRIIQSILARGLAGRPGLKSGRCATLWIDTAAKRVRVANDGEIVSLRPPLAYRMHHKGLCIGLPSPPNPTP